MSGKTLENFGITGQIGKGVIYISQSSQNEIK